MKRISSRRLASNQCHACASDRPVPPCHGGEPRSKADWERPGEPGRQ